MPTLKGRVEFKDKVTMPADSFEEYVNFTSGNASFIGMRFYSGGIDYLGSSVNYHLPYNHIDGGFWSNGGLYQTVDFGEIEQTVSQKFYDWVDNNTKKPLAVTIAYNDINIAEMSAGQSATLVCADKTMVSDVTVVSSDVGAACLLFGDVVAYISGVKTAKYLCKDKSPIRDIIVLAEPKPSEGLEIVERGSSSKYGDLKGRGTCTDADVVIPPLSPNGYRITMQSSTGVGAFTGDTDLISVFIPYSVTAIGSGSGLGHSGVFQGCTYLKKVQFSKHSKLHSIWERTFKDCINLESISLPKSLERIISNAFEGCTKLIQQENGVHYVDKWVQGADESATSISLRSNTVGMIDNTFGSHANLVSANLTSEITRIANSAFSGCEKLENVIIPDTVKNIGEYAFSGCTSLSTITLPEGLTSLGYRAFYECTNLACHIVIPDAITLIDGDTFAYSGITGVTFPNGLKKIGDEAFEACLNLTDLIFPNGIEEIGSSAFSRCSSLTSVEIPGSIETLGYYVFSSCPNLERVVINKGVTSIGDDMFASCTGLKSVGLTGSGASVEIPDSVTSIDSWAFSNCTNLVTVKMPNSVAKINQYAFQGCTSLASIEIPDNVISLGDYVLSGCSSLTSITIPAKVTSIGASAFNNCSGLTSIAIPNSVTKIGAGAFVGCANLNSISVDSGNSSYKDINGNLYTDDGTTLMQYAMGKADTSFTIPNGVTSIGDSALRTCKNLTSVAIPDSVTSIGIYAFAGCSSLASIIIPDGVTSIKNQTFANCPSLTSVVIPASVTNIEVGAFFNCSNLASIKYRGTEEQWNAITKGNAWDVYENNGYQPINYTMTYNYAG